MHGDRRFVGCTGTEAENEEDRLDNQPKLPWDGSDRDYSYQELLGTSDPSTVA